MIKKSLSEEIIHYVIELAWCDKTSFEMILQQTNLSESEVKEIMKKHLKPGSYKKWRERVAKRSEEHTSEL